MIYIIGDYVAGMLIGAATALAVRSVVSPGMDMVIAMLFGMGIGTLLHFVLGLIAAPVLGMGETMIPAMFIGMYGGMLFGMRDSMAAGSESLGAAVAVGIAFGALVVFGVKLYDRSLRGVVMDAGDD
jgi:hypothetical protein